jgi:hypothetical protein
VKITQGTVPEAIIPIPSPSLADDCVVTSLTSIGYKQAGPLGDKLL